MLRKEHSHADTAEGFCLTRPQISQGSALSEDQVFNGLGCAGKNISQALPWNNLSKDVKNFALTLHAPDAPRGSGWWHWVVLDIPAEARSLPLNAGPKAMLPQGIVETLTDFGAPGYGGPCPRPGDKAHRSVFTLYALDVPHLSLHAKAMPAQGSFALHDKVWARPR